MSQSTDLNLTGLNPTVVMMSPVESCGGNSNGRNKRTRLSLGQKREVVDLASSKQFTHRELAEKYNVGRTTITNICKQEELIKHETDSADAAKKKRKTTKCTYDLKILDESLHRWRMEMKVSCPDIKLTGAMLQSKAMELVQKILNEPFGKLPDKIRLSLSKFTASNGWLDGYRTRFGAFSSRQITETNVIKSVDLQSRIREIQRNLDGVSPQDIWCGNEFAIFYNTNPESSYLSDVNKGRFTATMFVSANGEKFNLQIIGVGRQLNEMENVDTKKKYNIMYSSSKSGWQVASTTMSMLKALNALAKSRKRKFRLILDSAVPHVKAAMMLDSQGDQRTFFIYDQLTIYFLPPNMKPNRCQPLHMGIIDSFKFRFRRELLECLFSNYELWVSTNNTSPFDPRCYLSMKNVFHWLSIGLHGLNKKFIRSTWIKSGLLPSDAVATLTVLNDNDATVEDTALGDLQWTITDIAQRVPEFLQWMGIQDLNAASFMDMDGNVGVVDSGVDETQIIRSVLSKHGYLATKRQDRKINGSVVPDNELGYTGMESSFTKGDFTEESIPDKELVMKSIDVIKRYLRTSNANLPDVAPTIIHLNDLKRPINETYNTALL